MKRLVWVNRRFHFNLPIGWLPNVVSRLKGTSIRLGHYASLVTKEQAMLKPNGQWSIKEHIGHLIDLEALHFGRLIDFENQSPILRAADMTNALTHQSNHNQQDLNQLILDFKRERNLFIERLLSLPDKIQAFEATHPRLNIIMKPIDMACFTAEHDDHHLVSIENLT